MKQTSLGTQSMIDRFIRYVKIDTQSDPRSDNCPSTPGQLNLARMLFGELSEMGLQEVSLDQNGYITATLPSNTQKDVPVVGFLAHMDTSPDFSGANVNPRIITNYKGGIITLNSDENIILDPKEFPELNDLHGEDLIITDGNSLLGADDKAGIAEIMEAMSFLINHPEMEHGTIRVGFTPDEEIGRGADRFPIRNFGADFAYTLDGGPLGELEYENFNAAAAKVDIHGRNVHPGTAKDKMINAIQLGIDFHSRLPRNQRPECTEGYEGFYHLVGYMGSIEHTVLEYIIRDHDKTLFEDKKNVLKQLVEQFNSQWGANTVTMSLRDQYYNMREKIEPVFHIVELARLAMIDLGIQPQIKAIRGGTDGAKLSFLGLPTPNLFTGGYNYHGRFEFIPISSLNQAKQLIVQIIRRLAKDPAGS